MSRQSIQLMTMLTTCSAANGSYDPAAAEGWAACPFGGMGLAVGLSCFFDQFP
jgi:hypothetical protein